MINYDDWKAGLIEQLKAKNVDVEEAFDWYSFHSAWEDKMKPSEAIADYLDWMNAA